MTPSYYFFVLTIRVLAGMKIQTFRVDCRPETLRIVRHPSGGGFSITIKARDYTNRAWFATEIVGVTFERG